MKSTMEKKIQRSETQNNRKNEQQKQNKKDQRK